MSTCKIYIKWTDADSLWSDIKRTDFGDYIKNGDCKKDNGSVFKNDARSSCSKYGDVNEVRPFRYSTDTGDCTDPDENNKWACFDVVNTDNPLPPPEFKAGNTTITSADDNVQFSNQTESWSDIYDGGDYMDMVAEYSLNNINNLYVSEKITGTSVTTYKIDIGLSSTLLVNSPWYDIMNSDFSDKVEFYIEIDNSQTEYLLEPVCWGPDNPCDVDNDNDYDDSDDDNGDSSGDSTANNTSSSNSLAIILVASIGGFLLLMLIIAIIFVFTRKKPSPSIE